MTAIVKIIGGILIFLLIVATSSALYFWYKGPVAGSGTTYEKPPEIKVVTKIKRVEVLGPTKIVTIEKQVVVEKLKLPDWFKNDANEQAIASAVIAPYKGKTNAVATLNTKSGVGQILVKQEPLPLFGFVNDREIGIRGGVNSKGAIESTVYGKWDFVRVGPVNVGVYGDIASTGDARIQVGAGFKF
jgi:hypothetical protein